MSGKRCMSLYKKECFAYFKSSLGVEKCKALNVLNCEHCRFFRTLEDYNKNVSPLKHKIKD